MSLLRPLTGPDDGRGPYGRLLALVWAVLYLIGLAFTLIPDAPVWVWVVSVAGGAAWFLRSLVGDRLPPVQLALEASMVVLGGVAGMSAQVLGAVPLAVGLILVIGRIERPVWMGPAAVLLGVASFGVGALLVPRGHPNVLALVLGCGATIVISALVGVTRRQSRLSVRRTTELEEAERRAERLDDHARVARELHDVLAHGLGGLAVQLDAVDALLESGRVEEAATRARAARELARESLVDARRAVDALRSDGDGPPVSADAVRASVQELLAAHRGLGARVDGRVDIGDGELPAATATALRRALQEALVNARKHAPGQPVSVRLVREGTGVRLSVENPVGRAHELARTGGGHGIEGMRERFARIAGGAVVAGESDGVFRVEAEAAT